MKPSALFLVVFTVALVAADQLTKWLAVNFLSTPVQVINGFFQFTFVMNFGIAFGLLPELGSFVVWIYIIALGLIMFFYDKFPKDRFNQIMLFMIISGILGNFIDRVAFGHVIDFISFSFWPAFNLADSYLTVGIVGMIGKEMIAKKK